jgi:hypothetical protein
VFGHWPVYPELTPVVCKIIRVAQVSAAAPASAPSSLALVHKI